MAIPTRERLEVARKKVIWRTRKGRGETGPEVKFH